MKRAVLVLLLFTAANCSRSKGDDDDDSLALPDGKFSVSAPLCVSTGAEPSYPDISHKATLLDFDDLIEHSWSIAGSVVVEVLKDSNCTLTIERSLFSNSGSKFSLSRSRTHTFEPAVCTFTVDNLGVTLELGQANGAPFADQTDAAEDLPFAVAAGESTFDLKTADAPGLGELWANYGCANPDQIFIQLTKITE